MTILTEAFFAQHRDIDSDTKTLIEAYVQNWPLPDQRLETLPHDVLIYGGKGAGKSTFTQNWMGHPEFFPVSGELSRGLIHDTIGRTFHGDLTKIFNLQSGNAANAVNEFLLWARIPVANGISGGRIAPRDFGWGRELSFQDRQTFAVKTVTTPLQVAHLVFCDPETALKRVNDRAKTRAGEEPINDFTKPKFIAGHGQAYYAWPLIAQHAPRTYLWDSRCKQQKLMGLIETVDDNAIRFYRLDNTALRRFNLGRNECRKLWNLSREFPKAYDQMWEGLMGEMAMRIPVEAWSMTALQTPSPEHAINAVKRFLESDAVKLGKLSISTPGMKQLSTMPRHIDALPNLRIINPNTPWRAHTPIHHLPKF